MDRGGECLLRQRVRVCLEALPFEDMDDEVREVVGTLSRSQGGVGGREAAKHEGRTRGDNA